MKAVIKRLIKRLIKKLGYDIIRYGPSKHAEARFLRVLNSRRIDLVIDIGANVGQFGEGLRELGYQGRIVSFEPLSEAFNSLAVAARNDPLWRVLRFAVGDKEGAVEINVFSNSQYSSILPMLPTELLPKEGLVAKGVEKVKLRTLDTLMPEIRGSASRVMLKIDTQGFERHVIAGARNSMAGVEIVYLEMSMVRLYGQEALFSEMHQLLSNYGFRLSALDPLMVDYETGEVIQADGLYVRDRIQQ